MRPFSGAPVGAQAERDALALQRSLPGCDGQLRYTIPPGTDRLDLARHLAASAVRARAGYMAGQFHEPTAAVVAVIGDLAAAFAAVGDGEPVRLAVRLDRDGSLKVRRWLIASRERAGDAAGVAEAIGELLQHWDRLMRYRPEADDADARRAPRQALDGGGWADL